LASRHLLVHHGGTFTARYIEQLQSKGPLIPSDAYWSSLVLDKVHYLLWHRFIEALARRMLAGAHAALTQIGRDEYEIEQNAPVDSLLDWDSPDLSSGPPQKESLASKLQRKTPDN